MNPTLGWIFIFFIASVIIGYGTDTSFFGRGFIENTIIGAFILVIIVIILEIIIFLFTGKL